MDRKRSTHYPRDMTIDSTLEQVARQLRACTKNNGGICRGDDQTGWLDYVDDARAVMLAARTPSENMIRAAAAKEAESPDKAWPDYFAAIYESMIDTMVERQL